MNVFLDTSALYAVLDKADANHPSALRTWTELLSGSDVVLTSNYVLVESSALVQNRLGMAALRTLFDEITPALEVEWITQADHEAATLAVQAAGRRNLSLVDCTSFQVMHRLGLLTAFVYDRHFQEQGFKVLPPPAAGSSGAKGAEGQSRGADADDRREPGTVGKIEARRRSVQP